jgi:hypothetical protein
MRQTKQINKTWQNKRSKISLQQTTGSPLVVKHYVSPSYNRQHRVGAFSSEPSANGQVAIRRWLETWRAHDSHWIREQWLTVECYCFFSPSRLKNAKIAETGNIKIELAKTNKTPHL